MSNFLQDKVINKLNGYYLILYAEDRKVTASCISCFNQAAVFVMVFFGLIPPRIKNDRD